jgi:hypothetical protein
MSRIIGFTVALVLLLPISVYVLNFTGGLATSHSTWAEFGDYLGGIYGSLALIVVVYTTYQAHLQLRSQSEDTTFYNLFNSLHHRIANITTEQNPGLASERNGFKTICDRFKVELKHEAALIGRKMLAEDPDSISDVSYSNLSNAIDWSRPRYTKFPGREAFIESIKSIQDPSERWEHLKAYIGTHGDEYFDVRQALEELGSISFYKVPFKQRRNAYSVVLEKMHEPYGEFLDGYFRTLQFLAELAKSGVNRHRYEKFIKSQLTRYESVIIFYLVAGSSNPSEFSALKELGFFERLKSVDCQILMIDFPSKEILEEELKCMFANAG